MRIGKPESDEKGFVRFEDIGIGCCFREYDDWNSDEPIYMKTNCFSVDIGRDRNVGYNTVNLKTGRMCGFEGTVRVELLVDAYIGGIE
mgnify:FL=1|jgi:hypothetical protein